VDDVSKFAETKGDTLIYSRGPWKKQTQTLKMASFLKLIWIFFY